MLMSVATYRLITGDLTSAPETVSAAVEESTSLLGDALGRELESEERTELLAADNRGYVHPRAVPVTAVSGASASQGDLAYSGFAVRLTSAPDAFIHLTDEVLSGYDDGYAAPDVSLTYTGGYTTATIPTTLRRGIALLARALTAATLHGGRGSREYGATSVSLGDASVSYGSSAVRRSGASAIIEDLVPGLVDSMSGYRRDTL